MFWFAVAGIAFALGAVGISFSIAFIFFGGFFLFVLVFRRRFFDFGYALDRTFYFFLFFFFFFFFLSLFSLPRAAGFSSSSSSFPAQA